MFFEAQLNKVLVSADFFLQRAEKRFGIYGTAIITGLFFLLVCSSYITPHFGYISLNGENYARLSQHPFDFSNPNPLQFRILTPLFGYLIGFRGKLFLLTPFIFKILFPSVVYFHYRKLTKQPSEALIFTALISFTNVYFLTIFHSYFTDITSYFFIFLCFIFIKKNRVLSSICFLFALLNHDSNILLSIPLIFYALYIDESKSTKPIFTSILVFIVPMGLYLLYRFIIKSLTDVEYDEHFYLNTSNIIHNLKLIGTNIPLGLFFVFKLLWFFPVYFFLFSIYKKNYKAVWLTVLFIGCALLQMLVAYDTTRLLCLCFPILFIAAERIREIWGPEKFKIFAVQLLLFNFLVPQYFLAWQGPIIQLPWLITLPYYLK